MKILVSLAAYYDLSAGAMGYKSTSLQVNVEKRGWKGVKVVPITTTTTTTRARRTTRAAAPVRTTRPRAAPLNFRIQGPMQVAPDIVMWQAFHPSAGTLATIPNDIDAYRSLATPTIFVLTDDEHWDPVLGPIVSSTGRTAVWVRINKITDRYEECLAIVRDISS